MATALVLGVEAPVSLTTSVVQISGVSAAKKLLIYESDVAVYVVVSSSATDGGALPASGRPKFATTALPIEYDISPFGFVGLAGASAGTCRVEFR